MKLRGMFAAPTSAHITHTEFSRTIKVLYGRIERLENELATLRSMRTLADSGKTPYSWGTGQGERYYHRRVIRSHADARIYPRCDEKEVINENEMEKLEPETTAISP